MRVGRRGPSLYTAMLAAIAWTVPALAADPQFQRIGPQRGLLADEIRVVDQDAIGFVWIGTNEGLLRYDGYGFATFERDVDDPDSLSDNQIRALLEDREGRLWIGTSAGGLDLFDRGTSRFVHHRHDPSDPTSIEDNAVFALLQDRTGAIWVGTSKGLTRYDTSKDRFESAGVDGWVVDLLEDTDGGLWVATFGEGVFARPPGGRAFRPVEVAGAPPEFRSRRARCLAQDARGTVWAGVAGGLLRFDPEIGAFHAVSIPIGPDAPEGLPTASALAASPDGTLWVGTPGGGLVAMDPRTQAGIRYAHRFGVENSLSSDNVQTLLLSRDGTLWIGTGDGVLNQLRRDAGLFTVRRSATDDFGFATRVVEDEAGSLWIGSFGRGVIVVDRSGDTVARSLDDPVADTGEQTIVSLHPSRTGGAWAGTTVGLVRFSPSARAERWWRFDPTKAGSLGPGYVTAICETSDETVWVGTQGSGLYRMRADRSSFEAFRKAQGADGLRDDTITALAEDRSGTLWIGTRSGGVSLVPRGERAPRGFLGRPGDLEALGQQNISSIVEDRGGRIWIGTQGGGLYRVDREAEGARVARLDEAEGLVDSNVTGVLEDDDGSLWVGTRRGLARYDPTDSAFATWGLDDGLPSPAVKFGSVWRGRSALHFGTAKGVVSVARGTPFPSLAPSPTVLTTLRTLEGPVSVSRPAWEVDRISIRYGEVLFVDYALLDFRGADRHRFAYRIGNESAGWVDVGDRRGLTFTDLEPGDHVLRVRGRNANGVWGETAHPLVIEVVPPFWMTWWFRLASVLAVAGAVFAGHRVRTTALERRNRVLEALQCEKQKALDAAHSSQDALHGAYDRLRALTRRMEDAKEEERRHIARELHDEMGQALSATKINLKALGRLADGPVLAERLADTLTLVDGMIAHVRALSLDLRPPLLEELGLVVSLRSYAEGQTLRTGLPIAVEANAEAFDVPGDIAIAAFRIVQEGVNNVLRHARARSVTVSVRRDRDRLALAVRDDGRGFDPGEALPRATVGGHVGLMGMRERVEALGGSFEVDSAPGRGTEIRASLPLPGGSTDR